MEEVLKTQSDDIKEFLLQTSILEKFCAESCNTVLNIDDSQLIIEKLEKNNMFVIPFYSERKWYRYHQPFADLLKQRLQQVEKASNIGLHKKASDWFMNNTLPLLAMDHSLATGDFEKSIKILDEVIEAMWESGQQIALIKYGDLIPADLILKNPNVCLYYGWILIMAGEIQKAEPFLASAEKITKQIIDDPDASK